MSDQGFYLPCPSNASMHIFEDNTLSSFTVNLPQPLVLKDQYDVGLAEIQYPQSWNNIRKGSNTFEIVYSYPHKTGKKKKEKHMVKKVPPGYYGNIPDLIKVIKSIYGSTLDKKSTDKVKLIGMDITYNPSTRRVHISADNLKLRIKRKSEKMDTPKVQHAEITLNGDVARLLGFMNGTVIAKGASLTSTFAATPSGGLHQMYLYADCIHPQPHPDGDVNILRTIAIDGEPHRDYVSKRFLKVYYYPLKPHTVTTIKFDILDDTGKHIGFDAGKVLVVLHFRKRKL